MNLLCHYRGRGGKGAGREREGREGGREGERGEREGRDGCYTYYDATTLFI